MREHFIHWRDSSTPRFLLQGEQEFKLISRAIELAYLTKGNYDHVIWVLMGETGHPESVVLGYAQAGIAIMEDRAYITKAY